MTDMDYKEMAVLNKAIASEWKNDICISRIGGMNPQEFFALNATAITDLLARAEAAEKRLEMSHAELEAARKAQLENMSRAEAAEARAEKAEMEKGAAVNLCGKLIALCSPPKEMESKLFRPCIKRPGDYMGSGYAFLDSFNRIFDEFTETSDEETYRTIREVAEQEILARTRRMIGQKEE